MFLYLDGTVTYWFSADSKAQQLRHFHGPFVIKHRLRLDEHFIHMIEERFLAEFGWVEVDKVVSDRVVQKISGLQIDAISKVANFDDSRKGFGPIICNPKNQK